MSQKTKPPISANALVRLRGIANEVFAKLGGGETFIRSERSTFSQ